MKWKIAAGVVVALILAGVGAMYYIAGTPQYSLYLVRKSIREDDPGAFFAHFDQERVIHNAIARAVGGVPSGPDIVSKQAIEVAVPAGVRVLEDRILERLESPSTIPLLDATVESVRYEGNGAVVVLRLPADGSMTSIAMTRMPDRHWKIVDLDLAKANVDFSMNDMM
jgi:hypothetical protein